MKKITSVIYYTDGSGIETIGYERLRNIELNNLGVSDVRKPSYGIILPSGRFEFKDTNGIFLGLINNNKLDNADISFYLSQSNNSQSLGTFISTFRCKDWKYDSENKIANCSLTSKLEQTKNIIFDASEFNGREKIEQLTLYDIFSIITSSNNLTSDIFVDGLISSIMDDIKIKFPKIENNKSYWYHIDQICKLIGAYCFVGYDRDGNERFELRVLD